MSEQLTSARILWGEGNQYLEKETPNSTEVISEETKLIKETEDKIKMNLNIIQQDLKGHSIYNK